MAGGMHGRGVCGTGHVWQGDMHGRGHAWWGVCMAGGMCGGGHAWQGSMHGEGPPHPAGTTATVYGQ